MIKFKKVNSTHENMIRAVVFFALAAANIAITSSVAAFLVIINSLKGNLTAIDILRAAIAQPLNGYAAQKKALKAALVEMSATIMKAVYTYAIANGDQVLAAKMKISRSKLNKMKYVDLVTFVAGAIAIVTPLIPSLTDYNVTLANVTLWSTAKDKLEDVISNPRNAIANKKATNEAIQTLLRDCMLLLTEQADQLAEQFKENNLNYYNEYHANRKLVPHHLSTQLRAHVLDELNQPIVGATVSIDGTDLTSTTNEEGYALVTKIPFGWYTVTITTGDNIRAFGPFEFKKGHSLTVHCTTAPTFGTVTKTETTPVEVNS
jgi:hypothetical protein